MAFLKAAIIALTATFVVVMVYGQSSTSVVDANCLGCICEASTKCNKTTGCVTASGYFCGPFLISWAYWADAGKPIIAGDDPERKGAMEACTNDLFCAAETVRKYMKKFGKDCNGDGQVTCTDYSRIHKLGYNSCSGIKDSNAYWTLYDQCALRLSLN